MGASAGWLNRNEQLVIEYLREEVNEVSCRQKNRLLVNKLGKMETGVRALATISCRVFCL